MRPAAAVGMLVSASTEGSVNREEKRTRALDPKKASEKDAVEPRVAACFLLLLTVFNSGAQQRPQVGGFYSDITYTSGDIVGTAVWIVRSEQDFWATVQIAEGHITAPEVVLAHVSGTKVRFSVPYPFADQGGKPLPPKMIPFEGTITPAGLRFDSGEFLKRRNSWQ